MPFFSVIIPVYNKALFLGETLKSLLAQTFTDFEVIVINDGSTDGSESVIQSFNDVRIRYYSKENEGVAVARNLGIEKTLGEFICFLDADDYWEPNFLATFKKQIDVLPNHKVFSCAIAIETAQKTIPARYSLARITDFQLVDFFDASRKECILWTSAVAIHKSVFEKTGTFDTQIKKGEDTELWMRIGLQYTIGFIGSILARYRYDKDSISRNWHYYFEPYTFEKYVVLEKENVKLKQFLDQNRFSAVIKCKLNGDKATAKVLYNQIDLDGLGLKKTILMEMPNPILRLLVRLKNVAANYGLGNSVFR
jgi:glycosyltransferase involved in cell wall biosynthesis